MAMSGSKRKEQKQQDAIALLMADHKSVQKLFKDFEKLDREEDEDALRELVETACAELRAHSTIEKEIFYPAIREQIEQGEDEDILNEAEVEHKFVDQLVKTLESLEASDPMYSAHFTVLSEYVVHHVKEEETEMFPRVKKLKELDLAALGDEMQVRKSELLGADDAGAKTAKPGKRKGRNEQSSEDAGAEEALEQPGRGGRR